MAWQKKIRKHPMLVAILMGLFLSLLVSIFFDLRVPQALDKNSSDESYLQVSSGMPASLPAPSSPASSQESHDQASDEYSMGTNGEPGAGPRGVDSGFASGDGLGDSSMDRSADGSIYEPGRGAEAPYVHPFDRASGYEERTLAAPKKVAMGMSQMADRIPASWEPSQSLEEIPVVDQSSLWKGTSQLLPSPLLAESLNSKSMKAIQGGGWLAIDIAKGEIVSVELFRSQADKITGRSMIEPRVVRRVPAEASGKAASRQVLNTVSTGIPVVRGIPGIQQGFYEVSEAPKCLVHYSTVQESQKCSVSLKNSIASLPITFRFDPAVGEKDEDGKVQPLPDDDPLYTTVLLESSPGNWVAIGKYNENFLPIGDVNHDGYPDFYLESNLPTANDSVFDMGRHDLLVSQQSGDGVRYRSYSAKYVGL